jgi:hypothetical protein
VGEQWITENKYNKGKKGMVIKELLLGEKKETV